MGEATIFYFVAVTRQIKYFFFLSEILKMCMIAALCMYSEFPNKRGGDEMAQKNRTGGRLLFGNSDYLESMFSMLILVHYE